MDTQDWDGFLFAAVFVTVVWVLPHIASDFGVSILCFVFFSPNFGPQLLFGDIATPGTQMQSGSDRNFGQPLAMVLLHSGLTCRAVLAENGQVIRFSCQTVHFGPFLVDLCLLFAIL